MKQQLILAVAVVAAMTGCTNEGFVGQWAEQTESAIAFGNANQAVTKADPTPADYAKKLGNSFVVYGWKNVSGTLSVVFDHYNVEFVDDTENSTESNLVGWEYSGIVPVNNTGKTEVISFTAVGSQSIKYWDKNATKYDFIAFSRGKGVNGATNTTYAKFSPVDRTKIGTETPVYSATGTVEELAQVYVADLVTVNNTDNKYFQSEAVTPQFRSVSAKVRVAFYETVPGYSIKSLTFYEGEVETENINVVLTVVDNTKSLAAGSGTMSVFIDNAGKASVKYTKDNGADAKELKFNAGIVLGATKELAEASGDYLGRTSNTASYTNATKDDAYINILPTGEGLALKVKVGYTLVSIDGSNEEIEVGPVEAVIPAEYTNWQLNYAYTYIFKISDKTGDLEPITLDAVVTESDGVQETVTEIITPSITTYAKDVNPTANNEYIKGTNIYLSVNGATLTAASNVKLYTVTVESGACQGITEASVANCIKNGNEDHVNNTWTVTDNNGKKLVVTAATGLSVENSIAADDAPDGKAISGNFAKFTPSAAGTYAFEFTDANSNKYYKIIQVVAAN